MGYMTDHSNWYRRITGDATERAAALRSGVTTSTLNRQLSKGELSAEVVIKLCRGYGVNPVEGLAATGHLTHEEATGMTVDSAAELISDPDLIRTLAYRINADPQAWFGTFGELADESDELAAKRDRSNTRRTDVEPLPYAANRRPLEPEEGDDDYGPGA